MCGFMVFSIIFISSGSMIMFIISMTMSVGIVCIMIDVYVIY